MNEETFNKLIKMNNELREISREYGTKMYFTTKYVSDKYYISTPNSKSIEDINKFVYDCINADKMTYEEFLHIMEDINKMYSLEDKKKQLFSEITKLIATYNYLY